MTANSKTSLEVEKNYAKEFAREAKKTGSLCKGRGSVIDRSQQGKVQVVGYLIDLIY